MVVSKRERFFAHRDFPGGFGPAFARTKVGSTLSYEGREMIYADYAWPFVACFNATGHPALNIPLGLGKEGLPLGAQVVGPYWSEPEIIAFAKHAARLSESFVNTPGLLTPPPMKQVERFA